MGEPSIAGDDPAKHFGTIDYLVFTIMLAISTGIGVFYGCFGNRQKTTKDFLMGGRTMGLIPVTLSLLASKQTSNNELHICITDRNTQ